MKFAASALLGVFCFFAACGVAFSGNLDLVFYAGMKDGADAGGSPATKSNGALFQIWIADKDREDDIEMVFEFLKDGKQEWSPLQVLNLDPYANGEKVVRLALDANMGDAGWDWCIWGEPGIMAGKKVVYDFAEHIAEAKLGVYKMMGNERQAQEGLGDTGATFLFKPSHSAGGVAKAVIRSWPPWKDVFAGGGVYADYVIDLSGFAVKNQDKLTVRWAMIKCQ